MVRKPRHLSAEEEALWAGVAARTNPIKKSAIAKKAKRPKPPAAPPRSPPAETDRFRVGQLATEAPQTRVDLSPDVAARLAAEPVRMDPRTLRKLGKGRLRPEDRIDLHGMTLAQAHPALTGFVLASHAAGLRLVLVITGKGRGGRDVHGPIPERRGLLRDQVPRWLASGPLRRAVMQVVPAHRSHGGGGAYYVYLRRLRN